LVETINGESASKSVYAETLKKIGFSTDYKRLEMRPRIR
jgi:hypothetical protein